jgi:hypothetical protein
MKGVYCMNNNMKDTSSKKTGKSSVTNNDSDNDVDFKNNSKVENSRSKLTSNKTSDSGNK